MSNLEAVPRARATAPLLAVLAATLLCACTADSNEVGAVTPNWPGNPLPSLSYQPGGVAISVVVEADDASGGLVDDVTLALSTDTPGITFDPATVTTHANGRALVTVLVPYGETVIAIATSPDGSTAQTELSAGPPLQLSAAPIATEPGGESPGQLVTVQAQAMFAGQPVPGIPIAFSTNVSALSFSPASAVTDASGNARAAVFLPYGSTDVVATLSGGGAVLPVQLSELLTPVQLAPFTYARTAEPGGTLLQVTTQAMAGSAPVVGLSIAFASSSSSVVFSPQTALTDAAGFATAQVFVPYGGASWLSATGGGAAIVQVLGAPEVPEPSITFQGAQQLVGPEFQVYACLHDADHSPLAGGTIAFSLVSGTAAPASVVSGSDGCASTTVLLAADAGTAAVTASFDGVSTCFTLPGGSSCE